MKGAISETKKRIFSRTVQTGINREVAPWGDYQGCDSVTGRGRGRGKEARWSNEKSQALVGKHRLRLQRDSVAKFEKKLSFWFLLGCRGGAIRPYFVQPPTNYLSPVVGGRKGDNRRCRASHHVVTERAFRSRNGRLRGRKLKKQSSARRVCFFPGGERNLC